MELDCSTFAQEFNQFVESRIFDQFLDQHFATDVFLNVHAKINHRNAVDPKARQRHISRNQSYSRASLLRCEHFNVDKGSDDGGILGAGHGA